MATADQIIARQLDEAGNTVSGLCLEEIGEDGHAVANKLWKIAGYIRKRQSPSQPSSPCTDSSAQAPD
jgi:nucleoside-triphosphatase THEP1